MLRTVASGIVWFVAFGMSVRAGEPTKFGTDVLVDGLHSRLAHVSTRPHNRKVLFHAPSNRWFIFYGTGHWIESEEDESVASTMERIVWRESSDNGKTWSDLQTAVSGNGHSSSTDVLLDGDRIFMAQARWGHWRAKAGIPWMHEGKAYYHRSTKDTFMFYMPYEVFAFDIGEVGLKPGESAEALPGDKHLAHGGPHYGSISHDTNGYYWVAALAGALDGYSTWVARSSRPDDMSAWQPHHVLFSSSGPGSHAPQIIALDEGRVACVLFTQHEQKTSIFVFDPMLALWGDPQTIGSGILSKRASAVFDPEGKRLHVVYTDAVGDARHRVLASPYGQNDWKPALHLSGTLIAKSAGTNQGDDDLSLSADLSKNPAPLALAHRGPDLGLHLRYYDGSHWSPKDIPIGLRSEEMTSDEVSTVADFSNGLAFIYWNQWKHPEKRKQHNDVGELRFGFVRDVASLFEQ